MNKKIDSFLNNITSKKIDSYNDIYKEIVSYNNYNNNKIDILRIFTDLSDNNRKIFKLDGDKIFSSLIDGDYKKIELGIFFKLDNGSSVIDEIITWMNKHKIIYDMIVRIVNGVLYLSIILIDIDIVMKVIDYIDCKFNTSIIKNDNLLFSIDNVMVSLINNYSYIEIISMYIYDYIKCMNALDKELNYNSFKDYMLNNYFNLENQIRMDRYLEFNIKNIKLSKFYTNLEEITNMIIYLFNGNTYEEFYSYYKKISRKNSKFKNKYLEYDNLDKCESLFNELVRVMYFNYKEDNVKESIINYRDTGMGDYITRISDMRKKVMSMNTFIVYLNTIDLNCELDKLFLVLNVEKKMKILRDASVSVYRTGFANRDSSNGMIMVARMLIRISYGDYSVITRDNDMRKIVIDNIDPKEVIYLIKKTLGIDKVKKDEMLYELYAEYIDKLCVQVNRMEELEIKNESVKDLYEVYLEIESLIKELESSKKEMPQKEVL